MVSFTRAEFDPQPNSSHIGYQKLRNAFILVNFWE